VLDESYIAGNTIYQPEPNTYEAALNIGLAEARQGNSNRSTPGAGGRNLIESSTRLKPRSLPQQSDIQCLLENSAKCKQQADGG
jgi:hypothetical protein